jgi:predicted RNA binding protein YcfA (HicA-like mRNA interferase family)
VATRGYDLKRRLEAMGFTFETSSGGGSHFKIKRDGQNTVPVALGNGLKTELSSKLLRKMARQLGVDVKTLENDK